MAVLTPNQLAHLRRLVAEKEATIPWDKPQVNAAYQAIEDTLTAQAPAISAAIDAATAPFAFSAAQKKRLLAAWCELKFRRDN